MSPWKPCTGTTVRAWIDQPVTSTLVLPALAVKLLSPSVILTPTGMPETVSASTSEPSVSPRPAVISSAAGPGALPTEKICARMASSWLSLPTPLLSVQVTMKRPPERAAMAGECCSFCEFELIVNSPPTRLPWPSRTWP
jgi:hypothetical protein